MSVVEKLCEMNRKERARKRAGKEELFNRRELDKALKPFAKLNFNNREAARMFINGYVNKELKFDFFKHLAEEPDRYHMKQHFPINRVVSIGTLIELYALLKLDLADPNYQEPVLQNTPLHVAVTINNLRALNLLLEFGAIPLPNKEDITPINLAKMLGHSEAYEILSHHFKTLNEEIKT